MPVTLPSISYVVARSYPDDIIGCENTLPWHLSTDLKRFKQITLDHAIIMGRKTYISIGKPLPRRTNVVLSRSPEPDQRNSFWGVNDTNLMWVNSRESALYIADIVAIAKGSSDIFVIGGEEMFRIYGELFNKVYLTEVIARFKSCKEPAYFDYRFDGRKWKTLESEEIPAGPNDEFPTRYCVLERKDKQVRYVETEQFYTDAKSKQQWIAKQLETVKSASKSSTRLENLDYQYKLLTETNL